MSLFDLEEYLRDSLGLREGSETFLAPVTGPARRVREWIELGGELEDEGWPLLPKTGRYYNHFHDPLRSWDAAGLTFNGPNESSVRWMQNRDQAGTGAAGGNWSWPDARRLYYQSLTDPDPRRREALLAATFRALGHIMHLVVDASNPDHARNDPHPAPPPLPSLGLFWNYDKWVQSQHGAAGSALEAAFVARFLSSPIAFDRAILDMPAPPGEALATVPVARLIDADQYDGSNPGVTFNAASPAAPSAIGIAEVANANFFSEDTFTGQYPFPRPGTDGLVRTELTLPRRTPDGRDLVRRYWTRPEGQGLLPANPLRAECAGSLNPRGGAARPYPCVDALVWGQVAAHMLPRAVGYARGVLEYFFRGSAAITGVEWTRTGITVHVQNTGTEVMEGVFEIYARHAPGTPAERRVRLATLGGGDPIRLEPGDEWTFRNAIVVPPEAEPTPAHVLVFRGRLGLEEDAVVGQIFTVPYVDVRQTTYDADIAPDCGRLPAVVSPPPYPKGVTTTVRTEMMRCEWRVVAHRVSGTLATNMPIDPATNRSEPIIERIEAAWRGGDVPGPAPLTLDGRPVGSVWQRQGSEADPTRFAIVDPVDRSRSYLYLLVSYRNGGQLEAHLAIFTWAVSAHAKRVVVDNRTPATPKYLVTSGRGVSGQLAYNWAIRDQILRPLFEAVSHGGVPVPTDTRAGRPFGGSYIISEGLLTTPVVYVDDAIDDFEVFASAEAAFTRFTAIEPLVSPHPDGPAYAWTAEVRRVYQLMEREFLRAFVTASPAPYTVTLTGQVLDDR